MRALTILMSSRIDHDALLFGPMFEFAQGLASEIGP